MNSISKSLRIVTILLVITAIFRLWTLMMIHTGIDERDYWYSAKSLSQGLEYPYINHRTIRWSVIIPVAAAQIVTGVHPNAYYVLPFLNAMAQTAILFMLAKRLFDRKTAVLACLFMIFFPYQIRAASQIRPEIFSITYILTMLWFFSLYWDAKEQETNRRWLVLSSIMLYIAYHAKITNLFFFPGMIVLILIHAKESRKKMLADSALFGGICLGAFLIETFIYGIVAGFPLGHLQIISANHLEGMRSLGSWTEIFNRYRSPYLQAYWQIPFILFAALSADALANRRHRLLPLIIVPALSFFLFITVAVSGIHPLKMAEPFINRYFSAVLPYVFIVISWYLGRALEAIRIRTRLRRQSILGVFYAVSCIGTVSFSVFFSLPIVPKALRAYITSPFTSNHPFSLNQRYRQTINDAWDSGIPIIGTSDHAGINALETAAWYYLDIDRYDGKRAPGPIPLSIGQSKGGFVSLGGRDPGTRPVFVNVIRKPFRMAIVQTELLPEISGETFPRNTKEVK